MAQIEIVGAVAAAGTLSGPLNAKWNLSGNAAGIGYPVIGATTLRVFENAGGILGEGFFVDDLGVEMPMDVSALGDLRIPVWHESERRAKWESPTTAAIPNTIKDAWVPLIIGNGVDVLTTGLYPAPFYLPQGTIVNVKLWGKEASGSVNVDLWADLFANVPPVVGDSITNGNPLVISSARKVEKDTATLASNGWITNVPAGGYFAYANIASVTTFTQLFLLIQVRRG